MYRALFSNTKLVAIVDRWVVSAITGDRENTGIVRVFKSRNGLARVSDMELQVMGSHARPVVNELVANNAEMAHNRMMPDR